MPSAPPTRSSHPSTLRGTSRAIYAVTGVVDEVNDLIVPGAFAHTLANRPVKAAWHHEWKDAVGVVLDVEEWLPGDRRFADVPNWPAEAGALVATVAYNRRTTKGRDTYEQVKQWHEHGEAAFSIGYRVPTDGATRRSDGVRVIHRLDLFEVSPVLHGAHPLTRSLEVKAATGPADMEAKATRSTVLLNVGTELVASMQAKTAAAAVMEAKASMGKPDGPIAAGLVVRAADTGRVLLLQRSLAEDDPAAGTWEFPGGHIETGEDPLAAAIREWQEETGSTLPASVKVVGDWTSPNGVYRGYVVVVPSEMDVQINVPHNERHVHNPDDPDGANKEVVAWWAIPALPAMPALRAEARHTPWSLLALDQGGGVREMVESKASGGLDKNRGGAEQLRHWYVNGEGAALITWGTPGDFGRCVAIAGKHMSSDDAKGYCNLRHHDALGIYPATHAAAEGKSARTIQHKAARAVVAEAKSRILAPGDPMTSAAQPLPESYEQFRSRLSDSVRELLGKDDGCWTCIEATYPDRVIVSVEHEGPGPSSTTYAIPYEVAGGDITLGKPQPVELATIVVPEGTGAHRAATTAEEVDARVVQPTVDALADATTRISATTADPEELEEVRATVRSLIAALSAKGLDIDPPDPEEEVDDVGRVDGSGMDLWDDDTFMDGDDSEESDGPAAAPVTAPAETAEETVRLDPEEVKAALAAMRP
ncbi:NUDIX domain-containing protein [Streptomyces sp. NPDC000880]